VPSLEHAFAVVYGTDFPALEEMVIRFCGSDADLRAFSGAEGGWWNDVNLLRWYGVSGDPWWTVRPCTFPARVLHIGRLRTVELTFEGVHRILDRGELLTAFADVMAAGLLLVKPESIALLGLQRVAPQSIALLGQRSVRNTYDVRTMRR
jgi:hypothetical protein